MSIEFTCHSCQKVLRVDDQFKGKKARCPNCQTVVLVTQDSASQNLSNQPNDPDDPFGNDPLADSDQFSNAEFENLDGEKLPASSNPFASDSPTNPYSAPSQSHVPGQSKYRENHRGSMILTLGILGIVCNICMAPGIASLLMGLSDLKKIKHGQMDPSGHGLTLAGTILGGIATGLAALVLLFYLLYFVIVFIVIVAGA